jgi:hypothetical protein
MLVDPPSSNRVFYSTFDQWSDIVEWYLNVTENKQEQTSELKAAADSILAGADSDMEKVRRIHNFITGSIRYSYMPFRQSAWIPQPAREVLATRIGDCKDMASLAKSFLDYAGIPGSLVLVNTLEDNRNSSSYIGPNFNHCIVSYNTGGGRRYLDMTDNNLSASCVPKSDQGAMALIVEQGLDSLIYLPVDSTDARATVRTIHSDIDADGEMHAVIMTMRTGILAGQIRAQYRFISELEQRRTLQKALNEAMPGVKIDSLSFYPSLDSLPDTLYYTYGYTVKDAAQLSANTAIIPLNLPDRIDGQSYPGEEERHYDINMGRSWFDRGDFVLEGFLKVPEAWRPITIPSEQKYFSDYGEYSLSFSFRRDTMSFVRRAKFNFPNLIKAGECAKLRDFLSKIARADNVQLMFFTDGERR